MNEWQTHYIPLSCPTKLAFRAFLPLATSLSVTVVHRFILPWGVSGSHQMKHVTSAIIKNNTTWYSHAVCLLVCVCPCWSHYWPGILGPVHHVFNVVLISHKVNAQQAGVAVGGVEGLKAVTQFLLHWQASQTAAQMLQVWGRNACWYSTVHKQKCCCSQTSMRLNSLWS